RESLLRLCPFLCGGHRPSSPSRTGPAPLGGRPPADAPTRPLGVDEILLGKVKFLTVVSDLETREPLWMGWSASGRLWIGSSPRRCRPAPARRAGRVRGH